MAKTIEQLSNELEIFASELRDAQEADKNELLVKIDKITLDAATAKADKKTQIVLDNIQNSISILATELEAAHESDFNRLADQMQEAAMVTAESIQELKIGQLHLKKSQSRIEEDLLAVRKDQAEHWNRQQALLDGQADLKQGQTNLWQRQDDIKANQDSWGNRILQAIGDGVATGLLMFELILALVAGIGVAAWIKRLAESATEKIYDQNLTPIGTVPRWESPFEQWLLAIACGILAAVIVIAIVSIFNHFIKQRSKKTS